MSQVLVVRADDLDEGSALAFTSDLLRFGDPVPAGTIVSPNLAITTTSPLPDATEGSSYSQQMTATGGTGSYTWSIITGSLPTGLSLASGGLLSGTATTAGNYNFTIQVGDGNTTDTLAATLTVASTTLAITSSSSLPVGEQNSSYSAPLYATGGTGSYTWSIDSGTLPTGLSLTGNTISGTPTTVQSSTVTVRATDTNANTATKAITINVVSSGSLWFEEDWTGTIRNSGGGGVATHVTLPSPGPWGTTDALYVLFYATNAEYQPQAGAVRDFPYPVDEFWMETWIRFDTNWTTLPFNPLYPGNCDHKTWFVYETNHEMRWEFKLGVYADSNVASAQNHDAHYQEMWDPPLTFGASWQENQNHKAAYPNGRLDMSTEVWDNQWHNVRVHCKLDSGPVDNPAGDAEYEIWWDGAKVISVLGLSLDHYRADRVTRRQLWKYCFGANRNSGPAVDMGFNYGPARTYLTNPGW